jgi:Flp pilus assembly protein TadD
MLTTKIWRAWRRRLAAPAGFLAVATLAACTPAGPRALLQGEHLLSEGKYSRAIAKFQVATQLLPANAQAWNHLGLAYHKSGQATLALKAYQQARRCDLNLTSVRYNLGCLLLEQNDPQAAAAELTTYTLLQHDSADGWLKLATAQTRTHQWDAAEKSFQMALHLRPDWPEALNGLGVVQTQHRRPREALASFNSALQKQPNYRPALLNVAILNQYYLNNRPAALQRYQQYLDTNPSDSNEIQEVIRRLQAEMAPPPHREPTNVVTTVTPMAPPPQTNLTAHPRSTSIVTVAHSPTNVPPAPAPVSTPVRPKNPAQTLVASAEQPSSGLHTAPEPPRKLDPPVPQTPPTRSASTPSVSEPPTVSPVVSSNRPPPEVPPPVVVQLNDDPAPKLARDLSPAPTPPVSTPPTSQHLVAASPAQFDQASALLSQSRQEDDIPEKTTVPKKRVVDRINPATWFRKKNGATDSTSVQPLPEIKPESPAKETASEQTSPTVARPAAPASTVSIRRYAYRSPPKPEPGDRVKADPYFADGLRAHRDGRLSEAIDSYRKATRLDPSFFEADYNLGLAAYDLKDTSQSLSAYETALSINPTSVNARYNFALALQQGGYFVDAARELEKVVGQKPDEARAHFSLASLYAEKLEQPSLARPHYQRVLALEPQHPQATAIRYWLAANP